MAQMISLSIDVTKIDKRKLVTGHKGTYLNLTISVNDAKDQFGNDVSSWQSQSQDERQAGNPKNYLGNGKVFWRGDAGSEKSKSSNASNASNGAHDDLHF